MKKLFAILLVCFFTGANAQLTFNTSQPIDTLIQDFIGSGVTLSNVTFTGGPISIGSFTGSSSLGSSQGIVLTSGNISGLMASPSVAFLNSPLGVPGDVDLDGLLTNQFTFDAAVLEFDFVATNSALLFDYVFASEEYNDYVNTSFNDVFGFFISGPGITGKQNIALIPGTTTPVSINNVNNGGPYGGVSNGPCTNCLYYHDNYADNTVAFDGFTTPLTATYTLTPGQTYHLKIAVADVFDQVFDTGVFLQKYSLRSVNPSALVENILDYAQVFLFDNNLHINLTESTFPKCTVYNINGSIVYEKQLTELNNTIPFEKYAPGLYSVMLQQNGNTQLKKVVKN